MSPEEYHLSVIPPTQISMPPEDFRYKPPYRPAADDDWYPVDEHGEPMPTADSGYRRTMDKGGYVPRTKGLKLSPQAQGGVIPASWKPTVQHPVPVVRCLHIKKDGNRCGRWSREGGTKCIMHEAKNAKAQAAAKVEAARLKLVGMADDAVNVLNDLLQPGTNDAIRLKAAESVLDRSGIKGALDINIEVEHKVDPAKGVEDRLNQIFKNNIAGEIEDVQDGEIVEDE